MVIISFILKGFALLLTGLLVKIGFGIKKQGYEANPFHQIFKTRYHTIDHTVPNLFTLIITAPVLALLGYILFDVNAFLGLFSLVAGFSWLFAILSFFAAVYDMFPGTLSSNELCTEDVAGVGVYGLAGLIVLGISALIF